MYTAQFSEFSFGYALTDNLIHAGWPLGARAPYFPSLVSEGLSGGFDVKIPLRPVALYLQFKIPQLVSRRTKYKPPTFTPPYLRMHLRTKRPNQHGLLLKWESRHRLVYYATPDFWQSSDLDYYYSERTVNQHTRFVRPSAIGNLDASRHHVAYQPGDANLWVCSEPRRLEASGDFNLFLADVEAAIRTAEPKTALDFLAEIERDIELISQIPFDGAESGPFQRRAPISLDPDEVVQTALTRTAGQVQMKLGCLLGVLGTDE